MVHVRLDVLSGLDWWFGLLTGMLNTAGARGTSGRLFKLSVTQFSTRHTHIETYRHKNILTFVKEITSCRMEKFYICVRREKITANDFKWLNRILRILGICSWKTALRKYLVWKESRKGPRILQLSLTEWHHNKQNDRTPGWTLFSCTKWSYQIWASAWHVWRWGLWEKNKSFKYVLFLISWF